MEGTRYATVAKLKLNYRKFDVKLASSSEQVGIDSCIIPAPRSGAHIDIDNDALRSIDLSTSGHKNKRVWFSVFIAVMQQYCQLVPSVLVPDAGNLGGLCRPLNFSFQTRWLSDRWAQDFRPASEPAHFEREYVDEFSRCPHNAQCVNPLHITFAYKSPFINNESDLAPKIKKRHHPNDELQIEYHLKHTEGTEKKEGYYSQKFGWKTIKRVKKDGPRLRPPSPRMTLPLVDFDFVPALSPIQNFLGAPIQAAPPNEADNFPFENISLPSLGLSPLLGIECSEDNLAETPNQFEFNMNL